MSSAAGSSASASSSASLRRRSIVAILATVLGVIGLLGMYLAVRVALDIWHDLTGPPFGSDGPHSGWTATWAGDVDGDGTPDILLTSLFEPRGRLRYGRARVFSGRTRECLRTLPDRKWPEFTYWVPACAGDVNGDGRDDLFTRHNDRRIAIDVLHGNRLLLLENELYELSAPVGDIDHDGCDDLLVSGQPRAERPVCFVSLVSGKSGHAIWSVEGRARKDQGLWRDFGNRGCAVGDIDGDGTVDIAIDTESNRIRLLSGRDGTTLRDLDVVVEDSGGILESAGDLDGDGDSDLLICATHDQPVQIIRVRDGKALFRIAPPSDGLNRPTSIGDFDGDSVPDLAIGWWDSMWVYSGAGGGELAHFTGTFFSANGADFDHDGRSDLLVTRNVWGEAAARLGDDVWRSGRVEVISGRDRSVLFALDGDELEPIMK